MRRTATKGKRCCSWAANGGALRLRVGVARGGGGRVRVGVGVVHPDSAENPEALPGSACQPKPDASGSTLKGAQTSGTSFVDLIPSEQFMERFAGNGILGVGDAVGNASSLLGEGIRWAIHAGRMAGE